MSLILTRSPFLIDRGLFDIGAILTLEIGSFDNANGGFLIEKTYTINFRNSKYVDIAQFIRDYLGYDKGNLNVVRYVRTTLSGLQSGQEVQNIINEYYASDGYLYSTDDYNTDSAEELKKNAWYAGCSDVVYKLDDADLQLPFFQPMPNMISGELTYESIDLTFYNKGKLVKNVDLLSEFTQGDSNVSNTKYSTSDTGAKSYKDRAEKGGYVLEETPCLKSYFDSAKIEEFDKIVITSGSGYSKVLKVETVSECKYSPYKVTFLNKYGVFEDLWFFKRSKKSMNVDKEEFRLNSLDRYQYGDAIKTISNFNVNGKEKIALNSGFVDERMNECFKQLLLSEYITLYDFKENKEYNVNLGTSEMSFKDHLADKLINYEVEFEFAHEIINNIG